MTDGHGSSWLGRGLEQVEGRPDDWAWRNEAREIRRHIHAKLNHPNAHIGARRFWRAHRGLGVEHAVERIQMRIHRANPVMQERLRQRDLERAAGGVRFDAEELAYIAARLGGANDPVGQAIVTRIAAAIGAAD